MRFIVYLFRLSYLPGLLLPSFFGSIAQGRFCSVQNLWNGYREHITGPTEMRLFRFHLNCNNLEIPIYC